MELLGPARGTERGEKKERGQRTWFVLLAAARKKTKGTKKVRTVRVPFSGKGIKGFKREWLKTSWRTLAPC